MSDLQHQVACVGKPRRRTFEEWLYDALGSHWCGNTNPPGCNLGVDLTDNRGVEDIARTLNDGFELWVGSREEWKWFCTGKAARQLAWFILWRWWAVGTWFGLRRTLWYWLLTRRCNRYKRALKQPQQDAERAE